jgi:large subunit ribosomal protein L21
MYVIVEIAGQQYKVEKDQNIFVHRLEGKEGSKLDFDKVLLVDNDGKIIVGEPVVKNMVVSASIVTHLKGDKVKVFKKKRRKGYRVLNGHRQFMTEIHIDAIGEGKVKAKAESAKESEKKAESKPETQADVIKTPKAESKPAAEKVAAKAKSEAKTGTKTTKAKPAAEKTSASREKPVSKAEPKTTKKKVTAKKPASKTAPKTAAKTKKSDDKKAGKS